MSRHPQRVLFLLTLSVLFLSCQKTPEVPEIGQADSLGIVRENQAYRQARDRYFQSHPDSPFLVDTTISYSGLKWFPVDVRYRGVSSLHLYETPETVAVMGTGGEIRRHLRYGYFEFPIPNLHGEALIIRLNAYRLVLPRASLFTGHQNALSIWFTDETTGKETYPVGRYIDIEEEKTDPNHRYVVDLNKAYNPFCAYSDVYSCAIPREEDHLPIPVRAGEMPYHAETSIVQSKGD